MARLRTVLDIQVPDEITNTQAQEILNSMKTYEGAVLSKEVLGKVITETQPEGWFHVHRANEEVCSMCREHSRDGLH